MSPVNRKCVAMSGVRWSRDARAVELGRAMDRTRVQQHQLEDDGPGREATKMRDAHSRGAGLHSAHASHDASQAERKDLFGG